MKYLTTGFLLLWLPAPVLAACTVSATGIAFGAYSPISGGALEATGEITVSCDESTAYEVTLDSGNGSYATRLLLGSSHELEYNLYLDAAHTMIWGDGSSGTSTAGGTTDASGEQHTVYGRIPGNQRDAGADSYADTLIVTVTY